MSKKMQIIFTAVAIVIVAGAGFFGGIYFKGDSVSNNKATNLNEEQRAQDLKLEENLKIEDTEIVKEEEISDEEENKKEPVEVVAGGKIVLSGNKTESGVKLSWTANNLGSLDGFKLVKSKEVNPVYPGSEYIYITNKDLRSYSWKITTGSKYHFRVCQYVGGKCVLYSNDIFLDTPEKEKGGDGDYASSVSLTATKDGDKVKLKWSISGGDAPNGFKVAKDDSANPEYPDDEWEYLSDSGTRSFSWSKNIKDGKTYHFRVCIYKGGKCGTYSNDVSISF